MPEIEQEASVSISSRFPILAGLAVLVLLFIGPVLWLYYVEIAGAVVASGHVSVAGKPKIVQHLDGGIVATIYVENGDQVAAGDVLLKLDSTLLTANMRIYENRIREAAARYARLLAERDAGGVVLPDQSILNRLSIDSDPAVVMAQQKLLEARRSTRTGQLSQLNEKILQLENQIAGVESLIESKSAQLRLIDDQLESLAGLRKMGLVPQSQLLGLARDKEDLLGQIAEHRSETARLQNSISEIRIQILLTDREFRESVLTELREVQQEVNDVAERIIATREQLRRIEIRAPVAGEVHELAVHTVGGVVAPREPIVQIIPRTDRLEIEAAIDPQFIDDVYIGQEVMVRFTAFDRRTTSELDGRVQRISADAIVDQRTGQSFYRVVAGISESERARLGGSVAVPGMPVEVFIKTRSRSALDYLTRPLMVQINRAFREE